MPFEVLTAVPDVITQMLCKSVKGFLGGNTPKSAIFLYFFERPLQQFCTTVQTVTNRKLHMGFRFVPKSVTLNDLERRNGRVLCVILTNSVAFRAHYVKVVEDTPTHSAS